MNTKRIFFWASFIIILVLIIWGLVVAMNKPASTGPKLGIPSDVVATDHVRLSDFASSTGITDPTKVKVTIVEYSDFQCPACASYYPIIERLMREASTSIRFVYRHFPLYPLPHKNSIVAAQAAEAAGGQGKFWDMYRTLFENQIAWQDSNTAGDIFEGYAQKIGIDMTTYKLAYASTDTKARVQHDRDEGEELGINSTPTFFVNGKAIVNPQGYEAFKKVVEDAASASTN